MSRVLFVPSTAGIPVQTTTNNGSKVNVPGDQYGHLEVALHSPRNPFGSIHTEGLTPIFQVDAVYPTANEALVSTGATISGTVDNNSGSYRVSSGTGQYSQAFVQGVKRLRYRPGQGVVARFTAKYSDPVPYSYQVVGVGHAEDGVFFGYADITGAATPEFGILYSSRGVREIQTLTVTTGATVGSDVTVTLNSVATPVTVTAASNTYRTAWEISQQEFSGWKAYPNGASVVFIADSAGAKAGTFSFSAGTTNAGASFAETRSGASATEEFIPQSTWNGDPLDGTGPSGITLDPTKGNVFQINIQYLGYGPLVFMVETTTASNNPTWTVVHTIARGNTEVISSFGNPSFPFSMAVYSAGSTSNLSVECPSFAGFIEGPKMLQGPRFHYDNDLETTVTAAAYWSLFTVLNPRVHDGKANQSVVNILDLSFAASHTQPVKFFLVKNGGLVGNPNFAQHATGSVTLIDTAATQVTFADNNQVLWGVSVPSTGGDSIEFSDIIELQPGEYVTLCARTTKNTAAFVAAAMNTREDQ